MCKCPLVCMCTGHLGSSEDSGVAWAQGKVAAEDAGQAGPGGLESQAETEADFAGTGSLGRWCREKAWRGGSAEPRGRGRGRGRRRAPSPGWLGEADLQRQRLSFCRAAPPACWALAPVLLIGGLPSLLRRC